MKRTIAAVLAVLLLTGCGDPQAYETMSDVYGAQEQPQPAEVTLELDTEEVSAAIAAEENGCLYLCDGYSVALQTFAAGDLDATVVAVTGYTKEKLQLLRRQEDGVIRYECVWTAAGEGGEQVGRTVILDDGNYHYTITVMAPAQLAGALTETWQTLLSSFSI